ncbi:GGDEF domain-containing protein [Rhodopirellula halodulae]|uniref:GGDEF domain-containing protein n=1 Tax=Rhodopirellula halodulae TaxID=2894198 RepID=UPI001E418C75|nr:GGDEF domain-containing protein [Rhodopirellula sp. JC737]MCC9655749.1 GGDEF domain-containing protein [Rhodopirellula sp. JC737]
MSDISSFSPGAACSPAFGSSESDAACVAEATLRQTPTASTAPTQDECCLVQIYPPDVIDGMMLLEQDEFQIGRSPESDLPLFDSSVSRRHARLIRDADGYVVRDLDSTNGTLVNEREIQGDVKLHTGDTVRIGSFLFRFLSADSIETQYHETVYNALTRDALTGTLNKRYMLEALGREISRSMRSQLEMTVVMLDIDHFKSVNDTHGHLVGDEVLQTFGKRIESICRVDDLLARYGGEEFCMVLAATGSDEAHEIAERCRQVICSEPFETAAGPLAISASFGFAVMNPSSPKTTNELLEAADNQLYEAKRSGRNRVCGEA